MKQLIIAALATMICSSLTAQKLDPSRVPEKVKRSFAKQYPGTGTVSWEMENREYEASFKKDGKSLSAMYKPDGVFTESETDIKVSELPSAVMAYMNEHYKTYPVKEASRITSARGVLTYEAGIKGMDLIFDSAGKFIKEVRD